MDSSGGGEKDGEGDGGSSIGGLHDHSDLLIPNPSFSPASTVSSMHIASPHSSCSDLDLQKQMDYPMTSPQSVSSICEPNGQQQMDFTVTQQQTQPSPPNVVVDDSPLQPCMDRNKESLKVKLLLRRPMNQLVEQGILPPPKTPAAFAGQRVRLERARMGDLLKAKIQQRPARQELIRQHILEDTDSRVAPSLAEKQRMLKRARLADSLNDHLIHRPGPLELVQKNILHAPDADIEQAIKDGMVSFKATSEGHVPGPSLPNKYTCNEDDSSSDISSPAGTPDGPSSGPTTEANTPISKQLSDPAIVPPEPSCEVTLQPAKTNKSETTQIILTTASTLVTPTPTTTTLFQVAAAAAKPAVATAVIPPPPPLPPSGPLNQTIVLSDGAVRELLPQLQSAGFQLAPHVQSAAASLVSTPSKSLQSSSSLGKSRSSKKSSKSKSQPKARTIKFHEYKGPANSQLKGMMNSISSSSTVPGSTAQSQAESSYELLLKQQQLFLQWQLEWQQKYPRILLPAAPKMTLPPGVKSSVATTLMSSYPVTTIPASLCATFNNQPSSQPIAVTTTINASSKPIAVALAPKPLEVTSVPTVTSIIVPKLIDKSQTIEEIKTESASSPSTPTNEGSKGEKSLKPANISEWKVNDLKAELKKRSLPVSGSKMQLVERLKAVASTSQLNCDASSTKGSSKMDVVGDESSRESLMDVNGTDDKPKLSPPQTPPAATVVLGTTAENNNVTANNNISILDLANGKLNGVPISLANLLDLLGLSVSNPSADNNAATATVTNNNLADVNNLKNAGLVAPSAKVINQLPISTVVANAKAAAAAASKNDPSKYVDENKILEQQKQIIELQKALRLSQQQLQQLSQQKDQKNGGPQKHRLVLQQHIQQKLQQQAIQTQLQNLIQLQTQQAEQKKQQLLLQQQQQQQQPAQLVLISSANNNNSQQIPQQTLTASVVSIPESNEAVSQQPLMEAVGQPQLVAQPSVKLENLQVNAAPQCLNAENSWVPVDVPESKKSLNFEDLVHTIDIKDMAKFNVIGNDKDSPHGVKSQMVDDVLEILIRNGELPPSAAQDPHAKAGSSAPPPPSSVGSLGRNDNSSSGTGSVVPPPPPPLPPPTFSVLLPTTIPFPRHQSQSTSEFIPSSTFPRKDDGLSKDAQEILRICEDLSNFGKSREAEAAASRLEAASKEQHHANYPTSSTSTAIMDGNGPSNTTMECGFFVDGKDFDLADSMDVGFDDTHSVSLHSTSSHKGQSLSDDFHKNQYQNSAQQPGYGLIMNSSNPHNPNSALGFKPPVDAALHHHNFMNDDELISVSLDMQMDTDYSDWLDTFLPDSNATGSGSTSSTSASVPSATLFHMSEADLSKNISGKRQPVADHFHHNNNISINVNNSNSLLSSLIDDPQHQQHHSMSAHQEQRDPLLSSRSFTRMPHPFGGDLQPQQLQHNFLLAHPHNNGTTTPTFIFHNPSTGSSATTSLMDTDFDELASSLNKKSETNNVTEMPSATAPSITTNSVSINDNFLWDFAM